MLRNFMAISSKVWIRRQIAGWEKLQPLPILRRMGHSGIDTRNELFFSVNETTRGCNAWVPHPLRFSKGAGLDSTSTTIVLTHRLLSPTLSLRGHSLGLFIPPSCHPEPAPFAGDGSAFSVNETTLGCRILCAFQRVR